MYYKKCIGEKIYLSPLSYDDYKLYTRWMNDEKVARGIKQAHNIITEEKEKDWIINAYKRNRYQFLIVSLNEDKPIGICGLELMNEISNRYHIVCLIGEKKYRNKGVGTEATKLLLEFGFEKLNAHTVYSTIYDFNEASKKAALKSGFRMAGKFHESVYYNLKYYDEVVIEMTKSEYIKKYKNT